MLPIESNTVPSVALNLQLFAYRSSIHSLSIIDIPLNGTLLWWGRCAIRYPMQKSWGWEWRSSSIHSSNSMQFFCQACAASYMGSLFDEHHAKEFHLSLAFIGFHLGRPTNLLRQNSASPAIQVNLNTSQQGAQSLQQCLNLVWRGRHSSETHLTTSHRRLSMRYPYSEQKGHLEPQQEFSIQKCKVWQLANWCQ